MSGQNGSALGLELQHRLGGGCKLLRFSEQRLLVGRSESTDVRLPELEVSAIHLRLESIGGSWHVTDLGSENGTTIDGVVLESEVVTPFPLAATLAVGPFLLKRVVARGEQTPTEDTAAIARRIVAGVIGALEQPLVEVVKGPNRGAQLELPPGAGPLQIGRGEECQLRLSDADVSRVHLTLVVDLSGTRACDFGSKNGTWIDGHPLQGSAPLRHQSEVKLGKTVLRYIDPAEMLLAGASGGDPSTPAAEHSGQRINADALASPVALAEVKAEEKASLEPGRTDWMVWFVGLAVLAAALVLCSYLVSA